MAFLTRLILIFSLLMQSVPGLTVMGCADMARGECQGNAESGKPVHKTCRCCCAHKDSATGGDKAMTCCCEQAEPDKPASPPSSPKNEQLQQFLALVPTLVDVLPPETMAAASNWSPLDPSPHRPSNSIQSLLCVWVM